MACSETFRNDQIEGTPDRFLRGKAEYSNRPRVPKADKAVGVGGDDPIRNCPENRLDQTVRYARRSPRFGARHRVVLCKIKDLQMSASRRSPNYGWSRDCLLKRLKYHSLVQ